MASFFLARLLSRRCTAAATTSSATSPLRSLHHALSSLRHLHSPSSSASHASNPNPNPSSLPATLGRGSTVYPSFPHSAHLGPVSLSEASDGGLIGVQSASLTPPIPAIVRLEFVKESEFGISAAGFGNAGLVPLLEVHGLEIEIETDDGGDEDEDEEGIVIRADSVKKKRKRKMNKHKLRKLRKKLRRKKLRRKT